MRHFHKFIAPPLIHQPGHGESRMQAGEGDRLPRQLVERLPGGAENLAHHRFQAACGIGGPAMPLRQHQAVAVIKSHAAGAAAAIRRQIDRFIARDRHANRPFAASQL